MAVQSIRRLSPTGGNVRVQVGLLGDPQSRRVAADRCGKTDQLSSVQFQYHGAIADEPDFETGFFQTFIRGHLAAPTARNSPRGPAIDIFLSIPPANGPTTPWWAHISRSLARRRGFIRGAGAIT